MGGMANLMEKMPGQMGQMAKGIQGASKASSTR